jgi:hypothetical protein
MHVLYETLPPLNMQFSLHFVHFRLSVCMYWCVFVKKEEAYRNPYNFKILFHKKFKFF